MAKKPKLVEMPPKEVMDGLNAELEKAGAKVVDNTPVARAVFEHTDGTKTIVEKPIVVHTCMMGQHVFQVFGAPTIEKNGD